MKKEVRLEDFATIEECSELVGLSVSTLRKMCMRKQIPFHKFGSRVRFYKPDLVKWMKDNKAA